MLLQILAACTGPRPHDGPNPGTTDTTNPTTDPGTPPPYTVDPDTIAAIEAAAERSLDRSNATGCSVAVWRDGAIVYTAAFGTRNEAGDPATVDTQFEIGSDTKKMTAIGLMRLVDAGALSLEDRVGDLLPDVVIPGAPNTLADLTVRQLLSHQSGLFDYTPWTDLPDDAALEEVVLGRFAENEYAMMPPGIGHSYSNPNYSLAGLVHQRLENRAWADLVLEEVAAPLGMDHTWSRLVDLLAAEDDVASGLGPVLEEPYDTFDLLEDVNDPGGYEIGWVRPEEQIDNGFTRPAGLLWSTASDMARLQMFLVNGDPAVLSDGSRAEISAGQVALYPNLDPDDFAYGFGMMRIRGFTDRDGNFYDTPLLVHGGNTLTMTSTFEFLPDQRVGVSVLSNGDGDDMEAVSAAALAGVAADRLPAPVEPISPWAPPAEDLGVYAGSFEDAALGPVELTLVDGEIHVEMPYLDSIGFPYGDTLIPYALDLFLLELDGAADFDLSFYPDPNGVPAAYAVNRGFVFQRVPAGTARRPAVPRTREALAAWLGPARSPLALTAPRPLR
ncbi:MAG: serine hydrolase domain-containing protein [Myxococcota bacterium]